MDFRTFLYNYIYTNYKLIKRYIQLLFDTNKQKSYYKYKNAKFKERLYMAKVSTDGKSTEEKMALADEISRGYFRQGLNCAECVLRTFMDMHDIDLPDDIIKIASGFGGGMGHTKNTCGAITGAVLALGTVKGRDPFEKEEMKDRIHQLQGEVYPTFGSMVSEIKENYGTLNCVNFPPFGDFAGKARKEKLYGNVAYCQPSLKNMQISK